MNPIIKWAGGKEKELAYIKENVPNKIERYIEPFVGGGAVFSSYFEFNWLNDCKNKLNLIPLPLPTVKNPPKLGIAEKFPNSSNIKFTLLFKVPPLLSAILTNC